MFVLVFMNNCHSTGLIKHQVNQVSPPSTHYSFVVYDSTLYYRWLENPKLRTVGGDRSSDPNEIIRHDSIVVIYKRDGIEIFDTILNPFAN